MANWDKMTESKYRAVKILLKGGASVKESAEFMELSTGTVYLINNTENFADYTQARAERDMNRKKAAAIKAKEKEQEKKEEPAAQVIEHRQTVTVQATWQMTQEMQKTNELLKQISNKLAYIVDELCGVKTDAKPDN